MIKTKTLFRAFGVVAFFAVAATVTLGHRAGVAAPRNSAKKKVSGAPTAAIVAQKMREFWARPAEEGMDGATTVVIHSVKIGAPHEWSILDGGGGRKGTKVWPAKVHWTYRTHYRTRTEVLERQWVMSCFKDGFNEWIVQSNGEKKTEKKREEPTTMK